MKNIATLLNIGLLTLLGYFIIEEGIPTNGSAILLCLFLFIAPIANLYQIHLKNQTGSENILSLYFKRKALEEKLKISNLQKQKDEI